ncbi:MAG: type II toxin-antitoxin system HicB family antitoxin [Halanaerobiales bacterium]|nr:type II toxin-antitoxin system HicB family antitoxin [Halanaerobiales bacterium]
MYEYKDILEEAKKDFEEGKNWIDFSNKYFRQGSKYLPSNKKERAKYLQSDVFKKVMGMKYELEEQQKDITGPEIPAIEEFSGKTVVRVPKSLHRDLFIISKKEVVSLNQIINLFLAQGVERYKKQW